MNSPLEVKNGSGAMFDAIAERYDMLNRILSMGIDVRWRTLAAEKLLADPKRRRNPLQFLDLATGTADLAIRVAEEYPRSHVQGTDPSPNMLLQGRRKIAEIGFEERVSLDAGDAQAIHADDASFDGVSIAFGIRNVPDRARALAEMARVTKPGGRVLVLELSEPQDRGMFSKIARFHVHTMVPALGAWLSGAKEYAYLQKSIAAFPPAAEFADVMRGQGLDVLEVVPLTFGVAHLYVATPRAVS